MRLTVLNELNSNSEPVTLDEFYSMARLSDVFSEQDAMLCLAAGIDEIKTLIGRPIVPSACIIGLSRNECKKQYISLCNFNIIDMQTVVVEHHEARPTVIESVYNKYTKELYIPHPVPNMVIRCTCGYEILPNDLKMAVINAGLTLFDQRGDMAFNNIKNVHQTERLIQKYKEV